MRVKREAVRRKNITPATPAPTYKGWEQHKKAQALLRRCLGREYCLGSLPSRGLSAGQHRLVSIGHPDWDDTPNHFPTIPGASARVMVGEDGKMRLVSLYLENIKSMEERSHETES